MKHFALFGNPVDHSKSPQIHALFSKYIGIKYTYNAINTKINEFSKTINKFFNEGGSGANVTVPFKKKAYNFSNQLTNRALLSGSVNTFKKINDKYILGDNTDGIGFLNDLKRLNFIKEKDSVLIIGAGGAARGIILPLFSIFCSITLTNRTLKHAEETAKAFNKFGIINVIDFNHLNSQKFDLIVNATSSSMHGTLIPLPISLIHKKIACYDLFYGKNNTIFLDWCQCNGVCKLSDGLGMLVGQAAHSCLLWHNVLPDINKIIKIIKQEL